MKKKTSDACLLNSAGMYALQVVQKMRVMLELIDIVFDNNNNETLRQF